MALIPISFKADVEDNQKGNIRAEDLSALLAFLNPATAGVLKISTDNSDCSYNGTPLIVGNTAQVTFRKGYIVIYGRIIYIEEGTQVSFNLPTSGNVSGVFGVKINLAEDGLNEVTWFQKTTSVQTDNLLNNTDSGVYEFVLYKYTATPTTFIIGDKTSQIINNIKDADFITQSISDSSNKVATTSFTQNLINSKIGQKAQTAIITGEVEIYIPNTQYHSNTEPTDNIWVKSGNAKYTDVYMNGIRILSVILPVSIKSNWYYFVLPNKLSLPSKIISRQNTPVDTNSLVETPVYNLVNLKMYTSPEYAPYVTTQVTVGCSVSGTSSDYKYFNTTIIINDQDDEISV